MVRVGEETGEGEGELDDVPGTVKWKLCEIRIRAGLAGSDMYVNSRGLPRMGSRRPVGIAIAAARGTMSSGEKEDGEAIAHSDTVDSSIADAMEATFEGGSDCFYFEYRVSVCS